MIEIVCFVWHCKKCGMLKNTVEKAYLTKISTPLSQKISKLGVSKF